MTSAASDPMPGSPYLEQAPKGLLTWTKLLLIGGPLLIVLTAASIFQGLWLEWSILLTLTLCITAVFRK